MGPERRGRVVFGGQRAMFQYVSAYWIVRLSRISDE